MVLKRTNQEQEIKGSSSKKLKKEKANRQMKMGSENFPFRTTQKREGEEQKTRREKKSCGIPKISTRNGVEKLTY